MLLKEREYYTSAQKKELKEAFGLFEAVHDRYITEQPAYLCDFHPLSELMLFAQFSLFYYQLPESKTMLLKMWELANKGKTFSQND